MRAGSNYQADASYLAFSTGKFLGWQAHQAAQRIDHPLNLLLGFTAW